MLRKQLGRMLRQTSHYFNPLWVILGYLSIITSYGLMNSLPLAMGAAKKAKPEATLPAPLKVAITVDDLPLHQDILSHETRTDIVKNFISVFKKHRLSDIYGFVNGHHLQKHPETKEVLKLWVEAGFHLGNHTYSHMSLTKNTPQSFIADLQKNEEVLKEFPDPLATKWFRYPYLDEGDTLEKRGVIQQALKNGHYRIADVTIDFEDWAWNNPYVRCLHNPHNLSNATTEKALKWLEDSYLEHGLARLTFARQAAKRLVNRDIKQILLLHVGTFDAKMLDKLLTAYENQNIQFITLSEAAADPIYQENYDLAFNYGYDFLRKLLIAKNLELPRVKELPFKELQALCTPSLS